MDLLKVPEPYYTVTEGIVNVPSEQFQNFINYVNNVVDCLNTQSRVISELCVRLLKNEENTAKISAVVEEIYEKI